MNRYPKENLVCKYVCPGGVGHYHPRQNRQHSDKPAAVQSRGVRARMRKLIDCRVCCRCKYAFISRGGSNVCSPCCRAAFDAYGEFTMTEPFGVLGYGIIRWWAVKSGFFSTAMARYTMYPRIPHPNLASIRPNITATMNGMAKNIGLKRLVYGDAMPRIEGTKPMPYLQPIADLRSKEGGIRVGRYA